MTLDELSYYKDIEIRFYDCDRHKRCRIETLLRYIADIAGLAYAQKGYSHTWLWEHGFVFLVSRVSLKIHRIPAPDEKLTVETWEQEIKGVQFMRSFAIWDANESCVAEAVTSWIMVEPIKRKILKPSEFEGRQDNISNKPYPNTLPCGKLKPPADLQAVGERKIVYSDIDANGHTYNAVYSAIACDFLPQELTEKTITDFRIEFKQEAMEGETLSISRSINGNIAVVVGNLPDGTPSFQAELTFSE